MTDKEKLLKARDMLDSAHLLVREVITGPLTPVNDGADLVRDVAVPVSSAMLDLANFCAVMR